ncbi:MAG: transposase [Alphaproteobacteria bacterium]|nr:transposase [Alphaproteobacteria bacterium]
MVYARRPFNGPDAALAHRIVIANSRLVAFDGKRVTFKWKNYHAKLCTAQTFSKPANLAGAFLAAHFFSNTRRVAVGGGVRVA